MAGVDVEVGADVNAEVMGLVVLVELVVDLGEGLAVRACCPALIGRGFGR